MICLKIRSNNNSSNLLTIHIKRISIGPAHIRRNVKDIKELKSTIADVGLLQPILVRQTDRGYTVVDGARRLEALKELGIEELIIGKDVIVETGEKEADETFKQLIANVQREDINDIELGHAFVALNEGYGYQYIEVAEIIGKTPHYVAAKVGLAKRLTPEVQAIVIKDWETTRPVRNKSNQDPDDVTGPYIMNVNVIEDIARLPAELQKSTYEVIKKKEMDKKEALRYLRNIKQDADVLQMAQDVKGLVQNYAVDGEDYAGKDAKKYIKKIDKDVERLFETIKSGNVAEVEQLIPALESLIEKLNLLYSEVKASKVTDQVITAEK